MRLREALNLCAAEHAADWVRLPGDRPATSMVAGIFDPGYEDQAMTRPLAGHSLVVYEPQPSLSLVWPVPEDDEEVERPHRNRGLSNAVAVKGYLGGEPETPFGGAE